MLVNTTGNSAIMPLTLGPTQPDSVTTVATSVATSDARSGISYQRRVISGILTWRKRCSSGMQIANATALASNAAGQRPMDRSRQRGQRDPDRDRAAAQLTSALWRCASTT